MIQACDGVRKSSRSVRVWDQLVRTAIAHKCARECHLGGLFALEGSSRDEMARARLWLVMQGQTTSRNVIARL